MSVGGLDAGVGLAGALFCTSLSPWLPWRWLPAFRSSITLSAVGVPRGRFVLLALAPTLTGVGSALGVTQLRPQQPHPNKARALEEND